MSARFRIPASFERPRPIRAAAFLALTVLGTATVRSAGPEATPQTVRLAQENENLRQLVDLAGRKEFYLVLDTSAAELRLMLKGVVLREYPVADIRLGAAEVAFVERSSRRWRDRIWSAGRLDPERPEERREVEIPDEAAAPDEEPVPPPPPEEMLPAPDRYLVRFDGGLALEVRTASGSGRHPSRGLVNVLERKLADVVDVIFGSGGPRLSVVLDPGDAGSLYRALPPDCNFLAM